MNLIPENQNDLAPLLQAILEELREQKTILAGIMTKEQPKPAKKLLTVAEATEYLRISERTLYFICMSRKIKSLTENLTAGFFSFPPIWIALWNSINTFQERKKSKKQRLRRLKASNLIRGRHNVN